MPEMQELAGPELPPDGKKENEDVKQYAEMTQVWRRGEAFRTIAEPPVLVTLLRLCTPLAERARILGTRLTAGGSESFMNTKSVLACTSIARSTHGLQSLLLLNQFCLQDL